MSSRYKVMYMFYPPAKFLTWLRGCPSTKKTLTKRVIWLGRHPARQDSWDIYRGLVCRTIRLGYSELILGIRNEVGFLRFKIVHEHTRVL
jgi:hypothetical protein